MATKKNLKDQEFQVTAKVTIETTIAISASSFEEAAVRAASLSYDDLVDVHGDLFEAGKPEISSIHC